MQLKRLLDCFLLQRTLNSHKVSIQRLNFVAFNVSVTFFSVYISGNASI